MNKKFLLTAVLLTLVSAVYAQAQDIRNAEGNDGKNAKFVKDGALVEIYNAEEGLIEGNDGPWVLIKTGDDAQGGVYRIKRSEGNGEYLSLSKNGKLSMISATISTAADGTVTKDVSGISTWILHLNSGGWSIMKQSDAALAVSRTEGKTAHEAFVMHAGLERNQGHKRQVWRIKQIGFVVNPEL